MTDRETHMLSKTTEWHSGCPKLTGNNTTAFVFAGGGSLGAVQVGMLQAIVEAGIKPDLLFGASVGALNAAFFASNPTRDGVNELKAIWQQIHRSDVFPMSPLTGFMALLRRSNYLCRPDGLDRLLNTYFSRNRFDGLKVPCFIVATEFYEGREVVLCSGSIMQALRASVAIPGIFPPVAYGKHFLIDGGVCNNTPVSCAAELGAKRIIVFPTGVRCAMERLPDNVIEMALHSLNILIARRLIEDIETHRRTTELWVIPPLCPVTVSMFDFSQSEKLINDAETFTKKWLMEEKGAGREGIPATLEPHHHRIG